MSLIPKPSGELKLNSDPGPSKRVKRVVLEEDEYLKKLDEIIQRDFFPDIDDLKLKNQYMDALAEHDVVKIKELQLKMFSQRNKTTDAAVSLCAPIKVDPWELGCESIRSDILLQMPTSDKSESTLPDTNDMNLDKFLANFTSEDNESFEEIMENHDHKLRQKHAWMYLAEKQHALNVQKSMAIKAADEQLFLEPPSRLGVDNWSYKAINSVMFVPEDAQWTNEEKIMRDKMKEREIVYKNTRLNENPWSSSSSKETSYAADAQLTHKGKVNAQGEEMDFKDPRQRFSLVVTPSPVPGLRDSPLMTWGEIEGTPFCLDRGEVPLSPFRGPSFKIRDTSLREKLAKSMADAVTKKSRQVKQEPQTDGSGTPWSGLRSIERLSTAAQRFASTKLGITTSSERPNSRCATPSPFFTGKSTPISTTYRSRERLIKRLVTPKVKPSPVPAATETKLPVQTSASNQSEKNSNSESENDIKDKAQPRRFRAADFF
ncbi:Protein DGCR14 -like protein [Trichinella pseudospiralis]|uniref:Protein DGCR14-like protein n=1 Tax=Trichinella pseudospiralis TaxID=6337 RepID=A0A0V0XN16_TRIPS|nr:Protein DGCR14 -like protein [Trichinella pseudospiralis]KRY66169.1 Protein DGCR14 -like protein [Trichinella pseudospiralis]KRY86762.1 Protein DGCR14 -like protein [Trichinella pseudospiralis]